MNGFIKLQRDIQDTWIYKDNRYFKAWCTILLNVNWKPSKVRIGAKTLDCGIGEALFSLDTWAQKLGRKDWNKDQVRRFFKRLATHHYISTEGDTGTTRLRVLESISYDDLEHGVSTIPTTELAHEPPPIEELRNNKEELRIKEEREKALSKIKELEKQLKESQLALKTEKENQRKKVAPKKESEMDVPFLDDEEKEQIQNDLLERQKGAHKFPNVTAKKTYVLKSPKQELENGQKKPYEIFLSSYPFEKKGWSEKLKQIFLTYCEIKNEKSHNGYANGQITLRVAEINRAIQKHEINWIEKIVELAANGAWASFEFDDRIKDRKDKKRKDEQQRKSNSKDKYGHLTVEESFRQALEDGYYDDNNSEQDSDWAKEYFANDDESPEQSF